MQASIAGVVFVIGAVIAFVLTLPGTVSCVSGDENFYVTTVAEPELTAVTHPMVG